MWNAELGGNHPMDMDCGEDVEQISINVEGLDACAGQHLHENGKCPAFAAHAHALTVQLSALFVAPRSPASTSVMAMHIPNHYTPHEYSIIYAAVIWLPYAADEGLS